MQGSDAHLDVLDGLRDRLYLLLGGFVDAFERLDGVRGVRDVTDAFFERLVEVFHLAFEVLVEFADLVLERLVFGEDVVDFVDVPEEHLDGFVGRVQARLRVL